MYNSNVMGHDDEVLIDLIRGVAWVITMEKNLSREDYLDMAGKLSEACVMLKIKAIGMGSEAA